jgi:hypothetical protein
MLLCLLHLFVFAVARVILVTRHSGTSAICPLTPQKRTLAGGSRTSATGQKRTCVTHSILA